MASDARDSAAEQSGSILPYATLPVVADKSQSPLYIVECFVLMYTAVYLIAGPIIDLSGWNAVAQTHPGVLEADAWRHGRMWLSQRIFDTAEYQGKTYNVYPPLMTMFCFVATTIGQWQGLSTDAVYPPWYVLFVAAPLPIIGFWAFQQVLRRPEWSAAFTALWLLGTPMLPSLNCARSSAITADDQVVGAAGLMLIAGDLLGKRRMWPAALGILIAGWTRQPMLIYGAAAVWIAWRYTSNPRRNVWIVGSAWVLAIGVLMVLCYLKFGNPFESGYRYLYAAGRERGIWGKRVAEHGVFSTYYLPQNAWYMNLAPPQFRFSREFLRQDNDSDGVSIWITCPILLGAVFGIRHWWRDRAARVLMACTLPVIAAILLYHAPGSPQVGHFRYALDFLPVWMLVIAPMMATGWRRHVSIACMVWSTWYFHMLP